MKVVFIAGPYRGAHAWEIEQNIRRAESVALSVWMMGAVALCPHAMTRYYEGALSDDVWLRGDLELLSRCDAIMLVEGWRRSAGSRGEYESARTRGLPTFERLDMLRKWIDGEQGK